MTVDIREQACGRSVAVVQIDRPPVNAVDDSMKRELLAVAAQLARDNSVGAVVLYGERAFSAGDDIKEMAGLDPTYALRGQERISAVCGAVANLPMPVVAAVRRFAIGGGCELALACDFRISAADAQWGLPEILLGLIPAGGGTQRLTHLIGTARAKRLIYLGGLISAAEALEIGLVDSAVAAEAVFDEALALAESLVRQPPLALRAAKMAVNAAAGDIGPGLELESHQFAGLFTTEDARHGLDSFLRHGPGRATFQGR